jgi:CDP-paratose 2-epimerase
MSQRRAGAPRTAADRSFERPVLITGGAGFIATNVAHRLLQTGQPVILFDNLVRDGVEHNVRWLERTHGPLVHFERGDVRDARAIKRVVRQVSHVYHFAAQVAVTTSLADPFLDFEINARGTLNLLEAARACDKPPSVLFTSTNKVYGGLKDVALRNHQTRYVPLDQAIAEAGVGEARHLEFHSPYGCSKGVAEQYVLDYARTFGLRTAVFRMSCIYGPHQFGTEDQGWVAHFLIATMRGQPLTIYGDGRQVRDVLFVDDLVDAMVLAVERIDRISGEAFNIGGGAAQTTSLIELIQLIADLRGEAPLTTFEPWRPADQRYYVSDTRKFRTATGWRPRVSVREGVTRLHSWLAGPEACEPAPDDRLAAS